MYVRVPTYLLTYLPAFLTFLRKHVITLNYQTIHEQIFSINLRFACGFNVVFPGPRSWELCGLFNREYGAQNFWHTSLAWSRYQERSPTDRACDRWIAKLRRIGSLRGRRVSADSSTSAPRRARQESECTGKSWEKSAVFSGARCGPQGWCPRFRSLPDSDLFSKMTKWRLLLLLRTARH